MRQIWKKGVLLLLVVGLCAGVLTGCVGATIRTAELVNTQTLDLREVELIQISYTSENLTFYASDSQELVLKEYMNIADVDYFARISQSDGALVIEPGQRQPNVNYRGYVEVYLPAGYDGHLRVSASSGAIHLELENSLQDLALSTSSGNIYLADLNTRIVDCQASSGRINVVQVTAADGVMLSASSGSITLEDISTAQLWAQTSSGKLVLEGVTAQTFGLSSSSGTQTLRDCRGAGSFDSTSGSQVLEFTELTGSVNAQASSGSISLSIPAGSGFRFQATTSSGRIVTDFDDQLSFEDRKLASGTVGNADNSWRIDLKTSSGKINVNYL